MEIKDAEFIESGIDFIEIKYKGFEGWITIEREYSHEPERWCGEVYIDYNKKREYVDICGNTKKEIIASFKDIVEKKILSNNNNNSKDSHD